MNARNNHQNDVVGPRNLGDDVREQDGWFRNSRIILLYFFAGFVIIRIWLLVVATDNKVYMAVTAVAMSSGVVFYLLWRRRYGIIQREEYAIRQREREIPGVTIQEFLAVQAALRSAQTGETVVAAGTLLPHNMPLLIAALPFITYEGTPSTAPKIKKQISVGNFQIGPTTHISNKVVPVTSDFTQDLELGDQAPLCMICLSNFQMGDILTALPCMCGHQYHRTCLIAWLERKTTCPLCTHSVAGMLLGPPPDAIPLPLANPVIRAWPNAVSGNRTQLSGRRGLRVGDAPIANVVNGFASNGTNNRDSVAVAVAVRSSDINTNDVQGSNERTHR